MPAVASAPHRPSLPVQETSAGWAQASEGSQEEPGAIKHLLRAQTLGWLLRLSHSAEQSRGGKGGVVGAPSQMRDLALPTVPKPGRRKTWDLHLLLYSLRSPRSLHYHTNRDEAIANPPRRFGANLVHTARPVGQGLTSAPTRPR